MSLLRMIFIATLFLISTHSAGAAGKYPLITYKCDTAADIIQLDNTLLPVSEGKDYPYTDTATEGSYSPWHLVDIDRTTAYTHITAARKIIKTCTLSSGAYTVTIEPQIFSHDPGGRCGETISAAVTIEHDGIDLQERIPFEDYCLGNSPVISRLVLMGKSGRIKIKRIPKFKYN